jgi:outer membrane biosynthesis protein TonB
MDVTVNHDRSKRPPSHPLPSLLGTGMAERLRSTSLALVGLVGAAALAVVGLALQQGAPPVSSGPIREAPRTEVSPGRVVAERTPAAASQSKPLDADPAVGLEVPPPPAAPPVEGDSPPAVAPQPPSIPATTVPRRGGQEGTEGSRPPGVPAPRRSPEPAPIPAAAQPAPAPPAEEPVAVPSSEPPPPSAAAAPESPSVPGNGNAYGKGNGNGPQGTGPPGLVGK